MDPSQLPLSLAHPLGFLFFSECDLSPNPPQMGYAEDKDVVGAQEYDKAKEKAGFVAGKHIHKQSRWWFQSKDKGKWVGEDEK